MKIRRIVVPRKNIVGERVSLEGDLFHYLCHVLRLDRGAELLLVDEGGGQHEGRIEEIHDGTVSVVLYQHRPVVPQTRPRLTLIYGISRRTRTELVWQKATELGVDWILPCICQRSVSRPVNTDHKQQRWQEILRQATRQSGRAHIPLLSTICSFGEALVAPEPAEVRLVADPSGAPLDQQQNALRTASGNIALLVGPEGGLTPEELQQAEIQRFTPVSLGPNILRTETAAITLLALVAYICGRLVPASSSTG